MKKFFYVIIIILIMDKIYCYNYVNWSDYYLYPYKENGRENFFPFFFEVLKKKHGIKIFIYKDIEKKEDINKKAKKIYEELKAQEKEKVLLIFINSFKKQGRIIITDEYGGIFKEEVIKILERKVLNKFVGRWYINELNLYTKIAGTFFYILEKENLSKTDMEKFRTEIIKVDNFIFNLAIKKPFADILNLFYLEPVSFIFYFPFVTYFVFVRIIGYNFGISGYRIANIIWTFFMIFIATLLYNEIYIILPEYMNLFLMFCGLSIPVYIYLYYIYKEEIQCALYNYLNKITGGFNESIFQK